MRRGDRLDACPGCPEAQTGQIHQVLRCLGQRSEAILDLGHQAGELRIVVGRRESLIQAQANRIVNDEFGRNERVQRHVQRRPDAFEGQARLAVMARFQEVNLLRQQLRVEIEADRGDVPALRRAQQVAGAADLEVFHRDAHSRAQLGRLEDGLQPLLGDFAQAHVFGVQQIGVRASRATTHPASQLVQLGEPEAVRAVDDERVGVRNVQS